MNDQQYPHWAQQTPAQSYASQPNGQPTGHQNSYTQQQMVAMHPGSMTTIPAPPAFPGMEQQQQEAETSTQTTTVITHERGRYIVQVPTPQPVYSGVQQTQYAQLQLPAPVQYTQPQPPASVPQTPALSAQQISNYGYLSTSTGAMQAPPNYDHLKRAPPPPPEPQASSSTQQTTSQTVLTQRYEGASEGGEARRQAEAQGQASLQQYEIQVSHILAGAKDTCPAEHPWVNMRGGFICGGGTHFIHHESIDNIVLGRTRDTVPYIRWVNAENSEGALHPAAHPPDVAHDLPMHGAHRKYMLDIAADNTPALSARASRQLSGMDLYDDPCTCVDRLGLIVIGSQRPLKRERRPRYSDQGIFQVGLGSTSGPKDVSDAYRERRG